MHPAHRSTLRYIQLLAIINSKLLKDYGFNAVLSPAIDDLKSLGTAVSGVILSRLWYSLYN